MNRLGFPDDYPSTFSAQVLRASYAMLRKRETPEVFLARQKHWTSTEREIVAAVLQRKGSVGGSDLSDATTQGAGGNLLTPYLRTNSVIDALLAAGATRAPDRVKMLVSGQAAVAAWPGNGRAIRMSKMDLQGTALATDKVGALTCATNESLEDTSAETEAILERDLRTAIDDAVSSAATDDTNAGSTEIPKSLTYDAPKIHSSGTAVANIATDFHAGLRELSDAGSDLQNVVAVVHSRTAATMATALGSGGSPAFPLVTPRGGSAFGVPLIVSSAVPNGGSPTSTIVALIDASDVVVCDKGAVVALDNATTIEMSDAPTGVSSDTPTAASSYLVSMFQAECTAIRVTRRITWALRRGLVRVIDGVAY